LYCWVKKNKKTYKIWHIVEIGAILLGDQEREIELHQALNDSED